MNSNMYASISILLFKVCYNLGNKLTYNSYLTVSSFPKHLKLASAVSYPP